MNIKNVEVTLLKVTNEKGKAKATGKPYDFYKASVVDEKGNVFGMNVKDEFVKSLKPEEIGVSLNKNIVAEIEFKPKGFDCSAQLVEFEYVK